MSRPLVLVCSILLVLFASVPLSSASSARVAAANVLPPCPTTLPSTITSSCTLTSDVSSPPNPDGYNYGYTVVASDVTFDCAGHTIAGINPFAGGYSGIAVNGVTGVTVENCTVTGYQNPISVGGGGNWSSPAFMDRV